MTGARAAYSWPFNYEYTDIALFCHVCVGVNAWEQVKVCVGVVVCRCSYL